MLADAPWMAQAVQALGARAAPASRADGGSQPPPRGARARGGRGSAPRPARRDRGRARRGAARRRQARGRSAHPRLARPLDDRQRERMRRHTIEGEELLAGIAGLEHLAPAVRATHEAWDGSGYPDGLAGDDIPLTARIVSVVDAFDAMTSERAYRRPLPRREALRRLRAGRGRAVRPARGRRDPARPLSRAGRRSRATSMRVCPSCPRSRSPRAGSTRRCAGATIESALAPGINALKTFDPPLHALEGATIDRRAAARQAPRRRRRRRPDAARAPDERRAPAALRQARRRCATARRGCSCGSPTDRELRLREFGTKQAAWVKLLRAGDVDGRRGARDARAGGVARPAGRCASCCSTRARGRCTRCCATSA